MMTPLHALLASAAALAAGASLAFAQAAPRDAAAEALAPAKARELIRLVRQDCGSCHGMTLQGGLGTPLTPEALAGKPAENLAATILYGRAGTAMPPWKTLLSEAEANWIADRLVAGFPEETP